MPLDISLAYYPIATSVLSLIAEPASAFCRSTPWGPYAEHGAETRPANVTVSSCRAASAILGCFKRRLALFDWLLHRQVPRASRLHQPPLVLPMGYLTMRQTASFDI